METKSPQTCPYTVNVRRNPHRKARPTTSTKVHQEVGAPPPEVSSFPIDDILAMEVPKNPNPNPESTSESLKVFLRIRPILSSVSPAKDPNPKPRAKSAWPKNPAKKKIDREKAAKKKKSSGEACIFVNDSQSVSLSPPLGLQESKRIKSEVYEGFSHVFAPDSSQEQVFEKMVGPLVDDFLRGKSGMLAALGPSGSGKTHTVFGSPRDPGVVPRTFHRIFGPNSDTASESRRLCKISIFEIHSERGKGEKLFDLCHGGSELSMQQSTIKGLHEVLVSNATEAESVVAQAMLRRLTAMTNSNSQSSRSQCIINIRSVAKNSNGEDDFAAKNAVLSIIDLAGAEREKKTGNQGVRLLESNFINNTSMVFGLCLRSLLEHQKNPKKPLQKHFQSSMLTRYLRDYLEGKKRMSLILTVKSGEEDYLDTNYLLRQASPFMRIRFDNVEEQANISCNKRQSQALSKRDKPKRMRMTESDTSVIEERKNTEDEHYAPAQGCLKEETKSDFPDSGPLECSNVELAKSERNYQILQKFAKALWTVLKQHGKQLKVAEHEIQHLSENLRLEKTRNIELEKQLRDLKSCCKCSQQKSVEIALAEPETASEHLVELNDHSINFDELSVDFFPFKYGLPDCNGTPKIYGSTPRQDHSKSAQKNLDTCSSSVRASEVDRSYQKCDSASGQNLGICSQLKETASPSCSKDSGLCSGQVFESPVKSLDVKAVKDSSVERTQQQYQVKQEDSLAGSKIMKYVADEQAFDDLVRETSALGSEDLKCIKNIQVFDASVKRNAFSSYSNELGCVDNEPEVDTLVRDVDVVDSASFCDELSQQKHQIDESCCGSGHDTEDFHDSRCFETDDSCTTANVSDHTMSSSPLVIDRDGSSLSIELADQSREKKDQELLNPSNIGKDDVVSSTVADTVDGSLSRTEKPKESTDSTSVKENLAVTEECNAANAPKNNKQRADTPSKAGKPKRRLLPASSALLRDFTTLDIGDKSENLKGIRGGKKSIDERNRTQGSISLLRMLNSNIRV